MANILQRFSTIISANINALLDRAEDPEKMIDEYLRQLADDLAEVKQNTASVMAEETRSKKLLDENEANIHKYQEYARKALEAGNDDDARVFLTKKQELETEGTSLANAYAVAHENATKMRQMHDKLVKDMNTLKSRRASIKAKNAIANSQEKVNQLTDNSATSQNAMDNFRRMEEKVDQRLAEANATAELNTSTGDDMKDLEAKYDMGASASVEDELQRMKADMGIDSADAEEEE